MWDILGRNRRDWQVRILGRQSELRSAHGLHITPHGPLAEANQADAVLFTSGREGVPAAIPDRAFMGAFRLDPRHHLIGSICSTRRGNRRARLSQEKARIFRFPPSIKNCSGEGRCIPRNAARR